MRFVYIHLIFHIIYIYIYSFYTHEPVLKNGSLIFITMDIYKLYMGVYACVTCEYVEEEYL